MKQRALSLMFAAIVCLIPALTASHDKPDRPAQEYGITGTPAVLPMNINKIIAWYSSNGIQESGSNLFSGAGMFYPRGTANVVYGSGIMWGCRVHDGQQTRLHVNGQYYSAGTRQGAILGIRTGIAQNSSDSTVRLYKFRRNFRSVDLRQDAADTYRKNLTDVTNADLLKLRNAYVADYAAWPWQYGAPFNDTGYVDQSGQRVGANNGVLDWGEDLNHNGVLDPGEDVNHNGVLDGETPGYADADMVIWYVCNDVGARPLGGGSSIGMEMQGTIWAYNRTDELGNVIFKRFKLIYKGLANTSATAYLDSVYVAQMSDPDLGDANDDYAGCDTMLNLGYVYNSTNSDRLFNNYQLPPPAVGFDLVQGPVVRGIAGQDVNRNGIDDASDYAMVNFQVKGPGYINLPMTSFIYFDRSTRYGSRYSDPFSSTGWYQTLRGLPPSPVGPPDPPLLVNPANFSPSRFWISGDPVLQYGWLDGPPPTYPGDREIQIASGPFAMAVGDSQEIAVAVVAGLGSSNLSSVKVMKFYDKAAKVAFNNNFKLPKGPSPPKVSVVSLDGQILLDWGQDSTAVVQTELPVLFGNYAFEGYNVYQVSDTATDLSTATRLATFDLVNGVRTISQEVFDPLAGESYMRPVQYGTDSGIKRSLLISTDQIWHRSLVNGQSYYFVVTAYNYTPNQSTTLRSVESAVQILQAIPESRRPGTIYAYKLGDTIAVRTVIGNSDAVVVPTIYNPRQQTGATYAVRFDTTTASTAYKWTLANATTGRVIYSNMTDLSGKNQYRVAEGGFDVTIGIPPVGLRSVQDQDGSDVYYPANANTSFAILGQRGTLRAMNGTGTTQRDYEIRFDGVGSYAIRMLVLNSQSRAIHVPFSVWDVGRSANDLPVRVIPSFKDSGNTPDTWNVTAHGVMLGGTLLKVFEPLYVTDIRYPTNGNDSTGVESHATEVFRASQGPEELNCALWGVFFVNKNGDGQPPPAGTVVRFTKFHEIRQGDVTEIRTVAAVYNDIKQSRADLASINVVPNPYYGDSETPTGLVKTRVMFTHLPGRATIRIFNLAGFLVRTLVKDDGPTGPQFFEWDLQNSYGLPVSSGLYIAYIEMPDLGLTKTLKCIIIQGKSALSGY